MSKPQPKEGFIEAEKGAIVMMSQDDDADPADGVWRTVAECVRANRARGSEPLAASSVLFMPQMERLHESFALPVSKAIYGLRERPGVMSKSEDGDDEVDLLAVIEALSKGAIGDILWQAGQKGGTTITYLRRPCCAVCHIAEMLMMRGALDQQIEALMGGAASYLGDSVDRAGQANDEIESALGVKPKLATEAE